MHNIHTKLIFSVDHTTSNAVNHLFYTCIMISSNVDLIPIGSFLNFFLLFKQDKNMNTGNEIL